MSYTPTEWKNGDIITEEKLNKIQEGIENLSTSGSGVECYDMYREGHTLGVRGLTYRDVQQKMAQGKIIILRDTDPMYENSSAIQIIIKFGVDSNGYYHVVSFTYNGSGEFTDNDIDHELQLYIEQ